MATLTVTLNSALGTSAKTLTFSAADATRIFNAWQARVQPGGTQDQFAAWLAARAQRQINEFVAAAETTTPTAPSMS